MNEHVLEYFHEFSDDFAPQGHFHRVIPLHDSPDIEWDVISATVENLPRGWLELSRLPTSDRIEFVRDFWISKFPYMPSADKNLRRFFSHLEDIGVFVTQSAFDAPYTVHIVYSIANNSGFFHGFPPLSEQEILLLQKKFEEEMSHGNYLLPPDYLAFLEIHNGFCKYSDTGLIPTQQLFSCYNHFQKFLSEQERLQDKRGELINPKSLFPFYESFGLHSYQCFWGEWYPDQEMGNVYYSGNENNLSDTSDSSQWADNMAFSTFMEWLLFYIEDVVAED